MFTHRVVTAATLFVAVLQITQIQSIIQVEIVCPGFTSLDGGNGALVYHVPAYEAAVKDANRLYMGIFNFSLTLIMDDWSTVEDNIAELVAKWYYARNRNSDIVTAVIAPGITRKVCPRNFYFLLYDGNDKHRKPDFIAFNRLT